MFHRKNAIPKSQMPSTCKYVEHYYHSKDKTERKWRTDYIQVASFDPALKNLAVRIERWNSDKTVVPVYFNKFNLCEGKSDDEADYVHASKELFVVLKKLEKILSECNVVVVERQLAINYKAVRISQQIITQISIITYNTDYLPSIYEVDPKLKGEIFGANSNGKITEDALKQWSVVKVTELLTSRNDTASLEVMKSNKNKQDDLADTVLQICAIFYYIYSQKLDDTLYERLKPLLS
jgi:hypothetical protein